MKTTIKILFGLLLSPILLVLSLSLLIIFWVGDLLLYPFVLKSFKKISSNELAIESFNEARKRDWKTRTYDCFAPLVTYWALIFTPWEANKLPRIFSKWDNNVSLNGDSGGVLYKGDWINFYDVRDVIPGGWEATTHLTKASYDDPIFDGEAYYAWNWIPKGFRHPRNFLVRWCWIGFRNRATGYAMSLGEHAWKKDVRVLSGSIEDPQADHYFLTNGYLYMFKEFKKIGPFNLIRSIGYKLDIVARSQQDSEIAAVVNIPFSMKRRKD